MKVEVIFFIFVPTITHIYKKEKKAIAPMEGEWGKRSQNKYPSLYYNNPHLEPKISTS